MATRTHARRHTIKVGTDKYFVGKKAARSVSKTADSKTVTTTKKGGGSIARKITTTGTTHGFRIGKYAKAHATTDATTGVTTYATKSGGTKSVALSVSGDPKKKKAKKSSSSSSSSSSSNPGSGNPGY